MRIGLSELIVIIIVALVVIGPDRLPEYARKLGEALLQFRKYSDEATKEIKESVVEPLKDAQKPLKDAAEPLKETDRQIRENIKEVKKSFADISKPQQSKKSDEADTDKPQKPQKPDETDTDKHGITDIDHNEVKGEKDLDDSGEGDDVALANDSAEDENVALANDSAKEKEIDGEETKETAGEDIT